MKNILFCSGIKARYWKVFSENLYFPIFNSLNEIFIGDNLSFFFIYSLYSQAA